MAFLIQPENLASVILSCYAFQSFFMLVWFSFFYLIIATLLFNWISALFCTLQHGIHLEGKAEGITQYVIHRRSPACRAAQRCLPRTPGSNAANETDRGYKYTCRDNLRWISQNKVFWFRSVKVKDCFLPFPQKWREKNKNQVNNLLKKTICLKTELKSQSNPLA